MAILSYLKMKILMALRNVAGKIMTLLIHLYSLLKPNKETYNFDVFECNPANLELSLFHFAKLCKKDPAHKGFTPINTFGIEDLPEDHRDVELVELIRAMSELTVRVAVTFTSCARPKRYLQRTKKTTSDTNNSKPTRTGTGRVERVDKFTKDEKINCPCVDCEKSSEPLQEWGEVWVLRAVHVVFNTLEAKHTICRVSFGEGKSEVVNIKGLRIDSKSDEGDTCWLVCITHDLALVDKLQKMKTKFDVLRWKVGKKYKNTSKLAFIVSHPHGCSKHVSIGEWFTRQERLGRGSRFNYTTPTCPGSSGASVYLLGCGMFFEHVHRGSDYANYSGAPWYELCKRKNKRI
ncbi:uncharacterized protein LOC131928212 [Physella acuta]|uniref:uncharacterized protein LOC131928212 n=1 Tax=Physella acuta TaxID=109671 RepID=UPI0027DCDF54|nr:uncharacterized protein LOC131928212 [Physella acuta]